MPNLPDLLSCLWCRCLLLLNCMPTGAKENRIWRSGRKKIAWRLVIISDDYNLKDCVFGTSRVFWIQSDWKALLPCFMSLFSNNTSRMNASELTLPFIRLNGCYSREIWDEWFVGRYLTCTFALIRSCSIEMTSDNRSTRSTGVKICENIRTLYFRNTRDIGVRIFIKGPRLSLGGVTNY